MRQNTKFADKPAALDVNNSFTIDLTDREISLEICTRWLETALETSTDDSFRRLISDVIEDLHALGSVEGELRSLVIGALGSVQSAMEIQGRS